MLIRIYEDSQWCGFEMYPLSLILYPLSLILYPFYPSSWIIML
jgi:hypothetical protein